MSEGTFPDVEAHLVHCQNDVCGKRRNHAMTQPTQNVLTTSLQRRCNVVTLQQRCKTFLRRCVVAGEYPVIVLPV